MCALRRPVVISGASVGIATQDDLALAARTALKQLARPNCKEPHSRHNVEYTLFK